LRICSMADWSIKESMLLAAAVTLVTLLIEIGQKAKGSE